jgi:hypothetical protein
MTRSRSILLPMTLLALTALALGAWAMPQDKPKLGYQNTPLLPGDKWHVHDGERPQPPVVTPGTELGQPPSDASVLFDGKDLSKWNCAGKIAYWKVEDGAMVAPTRGNPGSDGKISSNEEFGDCQIHVEFATPNPPKGQGQGRGNSGVLIMGRYEFQVLDSFENPTYPDGQASAIYGQYPPQVNASRKPGEWQSYDIIFTAPKFNKDGTLESPAYITGFHNGVLTQNHKALMGPMSHQTLTKYSPHGPKGPLSFQEHGNPVRYRNIWVRAIKDPE